MLNLNSWSLKTNLSFHHTLRLPLFVCWQIRMDDLSKRSDFNVPRIWKCSSKTIIKWATQWNALLSCLLKWTLHPHQTYHTDWNCKLITPSVDDLSSLKRSYLVSINREMTSLNTKFFKENGVLSVESLDIECIALLLTFNNWKFKIFLNSLVC